MSFMSTMAPSFVRHRMNSPSSAGRPGTTSTTTIKARPNFPMNPIWMAPGETGIHSILSANHADRARYRRLLSYTFSSLALRQQEHLLQSYTALLIHRTSAPTPHPHKHATVDTVHWLNFTTLDIIGDLSLGSSFHCLDETRYHSRLPVLFHPVKTGAFHVGYWSLVPS